MTRDLLTTLLEVVGVIAFVAGLWIVSGVGLAFIAAGMLAFLISERTTRK